MDVGYFAPLKDVWKRILRKWYRESRLRNVDKSVFPALVNLLWQESKPSNMVAGFTGSGLFPLNMEKPLAKVVGRRETAGSSQSQHQAESTPDSTRYLRDALLEVLVPQPSALVKNAMENSKRRRRRVQGPFGEVLTEPECLLRLASHSSVPKMARRSTAAEDVPAADGRMVLKKMPGDGSCLFACIAQATFGNHEVGTVAYVRNRAATYIFDHWAEYGDIVKNIHGVPTSAAYFLYMSERTSFGDETELVALSTVFNCCIEVYRDGRTALDLNHIYNEKSRGSGNVVRINLHCEHYDLIESMITEERSPTRKDCGLSASVSKGRSRMRKGVCRYSP